MNGHAWFHLQGFRRAVKEGKQAKILNEKYIVSAGNRRDPWLSSRTPRLFDHQDSCLPEFILFQNPVMKNTWQCIYLWLWFGVFMQSLNVISNKIINNDNPLLIRLYTKPWPYYWSRPTFRLLPNFERFHITFAMDMECRQGMLTPPVTWPRPIRDLHMFYLLRPILFPNLSLFFRTMHFEHPSVLYRFCFVKEMHILSDSLWQYIYITIINLVHCIAFPRVDFSGVTSHITCHFTVLQEF